MNKITKIAKNNTQLNELQALSEERNAIIIAQLQQMSEIHDNVARKILIGRFYEAYYNYTHYINSDKNSDLFINNNTNNNIKIIAVTDETVTFSVVTPDRVCYARGLNKTLKGGEFTKTIPLSCFSLDDRSIAKKARVMIYTYLKRIVHKQMDALHEENVSNLDKIDELKAQIKKLKHQVDFNNAQITHCKALYSKYGVLFHNKRFGDALPPKDKGSQYPGVKGTISVSEKKELLG